MSSHRNHSRTQQHFSNAHFERYYRHQLFSSSSNDDDDRDDKSESNLRSMLSTLSRPLPLTFRVTSNDHAEITLNAMKRAIEMESSTPPRLREISFLNDKERTFQIDNVSVNEAKEDLKTKHPSLHEFLTRANEGGDLSRYGNDLRLLLWFFVKECYSLSLSFLCVCVDARFFTYFNALTSSLSLSFVRSFVHVPHAGKNSSR
jgi:hypothetical protein